MESKPLYNNLVRIQNVYACDTIKNYYFFKNFTWQYSERMRTAQHSLTRTQRLKSAELSEVCQWILWAWTAYSSRYHLQYLQSDATLKCIGRNREQLYEDACYWHCLCCTKWQPWILMLTLQSIVKLHNINAEYWSIDVKLLLYLDTVF
jgi:hypothetical protein